jgi:hypothetical protein
MPVTILALGGSLAQHSTSLAAVRIALEGASEEAHAPSGPTYASSICRCTSRTRPMCLTGFECSATPPSTLHFPPSTLLESTWTCVSHTQDCPLTPKRTIDRPPSDRLHHGDKSVAAWEISIS